MEIKERLMLYIEYKGISKNKIETDCGLGKRYVSNIGNSMASDVIKRISDKYLDLNVDWLITGRGSMIYRDGGNQAYAIGDGSTNNAVAEGNVYAQNTEYIGSLKAQIEQLKKIVELQDEKIKMMEGDVR